MNAVNQAVKTNYSVVDESVYGNGETLIIAAGSKNFAVVRDGEEATIYQCFKQNTDWIFLPGSKGVKSFKGIQNFINKRI